MCDIYTAQCGGCGKDVPMHIGDFSTDRHNVTVHCPQCLEEALDYLTRIGHPETIVFQDFQEDGIYLIMVDRPRSIHLN